MANEDKNTTNEFTKFMMGLQDHLQKEARKYLIDHREELKNAMINDINFQKLIDGLFKDEDNKGIPKFLLN